MFNVRKRADIVERSKNVTPLDVSKFTPSMLAYLNYLEKGIDGCKDDAEMILFSRIAQSETQRSIIEALILGGATSEEVQKAFAVPEKSFIWYKELFFDTDQFITKLDRAQFLEELCKPGEGRDLKMRAMDIGGKEYILQLYGDYTVDQKRLLEILLEYGAMLILKAAACKSIPAASKELEKLISVAKGSMGISQGVRELNGEARQTMNLIEYIPMDLHTSFENPNDGKELV